MTNLIQLFSFDVVGSASYKTMRQGTVDPPAWIEAFAGFYEELPLLFTAEIGHLFFEEPGEIPEVPVWKAIGDELVFIAKPQDDRQVQLLTEACIRTMVKANARFQEKWELTIHGVTWSFEQGTRNQAVRFRELESHSAAVMDLIGPDVDLGFRLVSHAPAGGVLVPLCHAERLKNCALNVMPVGQAFLKGIRLDAYPLLLVTLPEVSADGLEPASPFA
jgi:class 3 adenylate cyclase